LTCADELGMSKEQITDDVMEMVKGEVSQGLGDWANAIKDMVKETIKNGAVNCPLGLVCSPSCTWQEVGGCIPLEAAW